MGRRSNPPWAVNREALARALDVVITEHPFGQSLLARDLKIEPLDIGALGRASPVPIELWVVRSWVPMIYVCLNQLVIRWGDEMLLATPPGDDGSLPAHRCPPLDGSCPLPALEERQARPDRLATLQAGGLFEPVSLAARLHPLLRRRQIGPLLESEERKQILTLLFALCFWDGFGSKELSYATFLPQAQQVPESIVKDLGRPQYGEAPVRYEHEQEHRDVDIEVECFPHRWEACRLSDEGWTRGYLLQERPHDSQVGGKTIRLWHCTLVVSETEWELRRELLWTRSEDGLEMS